MSYIILIGVIICIFAMVYGYWLLFKKSFRILDNPTLLEKFFELVIKTVKRRNRRIEALKTAENFIKPYENIFSDLILSNKFCIIKLDTRMNAISLKSKKFNNEGKKLSAFANNFLKIDENECFNRLCELFGYKTTFEESLEIITAYSKVKTEIIATQEKEAVSEEKNKQEDTLKSEQNIFVERDFSNKIDINNSSESELIGLPGINVILAKKIIKFREEEHQFYSVQEFLRVMKIKPHFAKQLKDLVIVRKINIQKVKKAKRERIIDI